MGHNGKRGRCEPGRADTLICDARGRAVCFTSAEPSHLSKTMQPALAQLRAIVPDGRILLGFDRGGAYAEAFTACQDADIDFVTYRRGTLAATTAEPVAHQVKRGRKTVTVVLADEQIAFSDDYTGPCRQLTLYERRDCTCDPTLDPTLRPDPRPGGLSAPGGGAAGADQRPDRAGGGPAVRVEGPLGDRERVQVPGLLRHRLASLYFRRVPAPAARAGRQWTCRSLRHHLSCLRT